MPKYSIIKTELENYREDILSIRSRNILDNHGAIFNWKYIGNPNGNAKCWLAREDRFNKYVGSVAIFPRIFFIEGSPRTVWEVGDFAVDKEHRTLGPAILLQKQVIHEMNENSGLNWIYGVPNRESRVIFNRIGYRKLGLHSRYVKLMGTEKKLTKGGIKYKAVTRITDILLKYVSAEQYYKRPYGINVEITDHFDERFDILWQRILGQYLIVEDRRSGFLNWRFTKHPNLQHYVFMIYKDNTLTNYIVYYINDNICYIVDIFGERSRNMIGYCIAEFIRYIRNCRVEKIEMQYFGSNLFKEIIKKYGFIRRDDGANDIVIRMNPKTECINNMFSDDNWHFTEGDRD